MRIFKGIQSSLSTDGNQDTFFGKESDVTELSIDPSFNDSSSTEIRATIRDEEYREVRLTMDMRLLSQMILMLASDLEYHGFSERDCQQIHEVSELIVKMKLAEVTT